MDAGAEVSPYPYVLIYPQDQHERLLVAQLQALGVEVERQTELVSFQDDDNQVTAVLRRADETEECVTARYLAGCDGARSFVRHRIGGGFEGGTYKQLFYVADVTAEGLDPSGEAHIAFEKSEFVMVLSYGEAGRYRCIGTVRDQRAEYPESLTFEDVGHEAINGLNINITGVNWFSTYRVHHRVSDRFRHGRVFLLGDAAHVHSPAGGQGMNTGILDANNLAWKLAAVLRGSAPESLLDSYQVERRAFAQKLVATTDKVFSFATAQGSLADFLGTRIAPIFASVAYKRENVREYMFRLISQTTLNYQDGPLSEGKAGEVRGGDRLPWVSLLGADNHAPLSVIGWQLHVYGEVKPELEEWCSQHKLPVHIFNWHEDHQRAGLAKDAAYLLRPDGYVALADTEGTPAAVTRYFNAHSFILPV